MRPIEYAKASIETMKCAKKKTMRSMEQSNGMGSCCTSG